MHISELWLRELVDPPHATTALAEQLTMAGLEVGGITQAAPDFSGVVLGKVVACQEHPNAEKLSLCNVDVGAGKILQIVCGAPNVRKGLTVAVATVGAILPGDFKIRQAKLRGEDSEGMICSARELGLGEEHDGILELPDGEPGADFRNFLSLDDSILELDLTPNRGDCLGMFGVAREVAALNGMRFTRPQATPVTATDSAVLEVHLEAPADCPLFAGRVIKNLNPDAETPLWMKERLRRAGLRAIHPVVDVTNYVMIESGKPMHGFDLATMRGDVTVRRAHANEAMTLLDGREILLDEDMLVVTDAGGPRALAGIMGGADSGVSATTTAIFLESAFFAPLAVAGKARRYGLHTDASHRFERGVDPTLCADSVERATELILEICGGEPGPTVVTEAVDCLPQRVSVELAQTHLERLIGRSYDKTEVTRLLGNLGLQTAETRDGWAVVIPSHRFDLEIPEDLIEEIARVVGYDEVQETPAMANLVMAPQTETRVPLSRVRDTLVSRGYQEAITYSFVDPAWHIALCPDVTPLQLKNPISTDLSVMRASLLPGLLMALKNNQSRQKPRVRLFETGLRFVPQDTDINQENVIGVIAGGTRFAEQWGTSDATVGFFDLKNDIEALLALGGRGRTIEFCAAEHPVLHPGQSAEIRIDGEPVGWIGALHPQIMAQLEIEGEIMFSELQLDGALSAAIPQFTPVSRFPEVRRDLSFVIDEDITVDQIIRSVRAVAPQILKDLRVFDIYRGKGIEAGTKSIALGLILQESSRTLTDVDADEAVAAVTKSLKQNLHAKIRQ